jgi:hypothetical protein
MLGVQQLTPLMGEVCRFANPRRRRRALAALRQEAADLEETLAFAREQQEELAEQLIREVFEVRPEEPTRPPTRFSDGSLPVFYAARDWVTAGAERGWYVQEDAGGALSFGPVHLHRLECRLVTEGYDLRPMALAWSFLTDPDRNRAYPDCQALAAEAAENGAGALFTFSARLSGGVNTPVFRDDALLSPKLLGRSVFSIREGTLVIDNE